MSVLFYKTGQPEKLLRKYPHNIYTEKHVFISIYLSIYLSIYASIYTNTYVPTHTHAHSMTDTYIHKNTDG